ncbi:uncharacterized protein ACNS7B_006059 isoform 3-T3 [Menidia menidia]
MLIVLLLNLAGELTWLGSTQMENGRNSTPDFYQHSLAIPSVFGLFFLIVFEIIGIIAELPAHTKECKGPPYDKRDVYWGFCFALFVAIVNLSSYHVYTLSYGCGIIMFSIRGAKRKYSFLRELRKRKSAWRSK